MKVTIFTGNQRRHFGLVNRLALFSDEVHAVIEVPTSSRENRTDTTNGQSSISRYMSNVRDSEKKYFPDSEALSSTIRKTECAAGSLSKLSPSELDEALDADLFIVFGSSFIKGWLCDYLVEKAAINLHLGLSPYYRGSACNFWAVNDKNPNFVGATWHLLSRGLDSGPILIHSVPNHDGENVFDFTMKAVAIAHSDFFQNFEKFTESAIQPKIQNPDLEIRNSRINEFTDDVAKDFLEGDYSRDYLRNLIENSKKPELFLVDGNSN